jgi:hypothetical protein
MSATVLVVLMRWPRRGEGKSRLAADIGVDATHRLHRAFVADTLAWPAPRPRLLAVAPDAAAVAAARAAAPDAAVVAQAGGALGRRIAGALRAAFAGGAECAVLVGTDSPSLPHRLVMGCSAAAADSGAAMVPARDGGFVALALHRDVASSRGLSWLESSRIAWSTETAAGDTRGAAREGGLEIAVTAPWYDVDGVADLDRLRADLLRDPLRAPRTLHCLQALGRPVGAERAS